MKSTLMKKDFTLVLIGQVISIFGNSILCFAIPLYLLNQTGSAAIYGTISASAFIPMLILSPVGGLLADRVNKKNIMVVLDFITMALILAYALVLDRLPLVSLTLMVLLLLYGIKGIYQPAVNASVPALVAGRDMIRANGMVNAVTSVSSLIGPGLGGLIYGIWGIYPLLYISAVCFGFSAVMEIFIRIPGTYAKKEGGLFRTAFGELKETFLYIQRERRSIWQLALLVLAANMIISAMLGTSYPVVITQKLGFGEELANQLYGYLSSITAAGSLLGAVLAGHISSKMKVRHGYWILLAFTLPSAVMGLSLCLDNSWLIYGVFCVFGFLTSVFAALVSVQIMSYIQILSPNHMVGRIMGCLSAIFMCGQPAGNAIFGLLLEALDKAIPVVFLCAAGAFGLITLKSKGVFVQLEKQL